MKRHIVVNLEEMYLGRCGYFVRRHGLCKHGLALEPFLFTTLTYGQPETIQIQ